MTFTYFYATPNLLTLPDNLLHKPHLLHQSLLFHIISNNGFSGCCCFFAGVSLHLFQAQSADSLTGSLPQTAVVLPCGGLLNREFCECGVAVVARKKKFKITCNFNGTKLAKNREVPNLGVKNQQFRSIFIFNLSNSKLFWLNNHLAVA